MASFSMETMYLKFIFYIFVTFKGESVIPNLNINVCERDIILSLKQVIRKLHRKKSFRYSFPQPGCHLPNSPWAGIMTSFINYFRLG
jgi:hypothetical protein